MGKFDMKRFILPAVLLVSPIACTTSNGTVTVNLGNTQAEATAIYAALSPFVSLVSNPSEQTAYETLGVAVKAYAGLPNGTMPTATAISALTSDFSSVLSQVSLPSDTKLAIDAGLGLIDALGTGVTSVPVPASAGATTGSAPAAGEVVPAPISIPLS